MKTKIIKCYFCGKKHPGGVITPHIEDGIHCPYDSGVPFEERERIAIIKSEHPQSGLLEFMKIVKMEAVKQLVEMTERKYP